MKQTVYHIHLRDLLIYAYHGVLEGERAVGQRFRLNLELRAAPLSNPLTDTLEGRVNYAEVHEVVHREFTRCSCETLEAAGAQLAEAIFADFPGVESLRLRLDKPSVPVDCACDSFGVELEFQR
ncbi:MAG: dihydroneopterin aldolase [Opitutales bacterium]